MVTPIKTVQSIILIKETAIQSWLRDASTFALFAGLIGLGWLIDSSAMQWMGAVVAFITACARPHFAKYTYTIPEARKRLDELEAS